MVFRSQGRPRAAPGIRLATGRSLPHRTSTEAEGRLATAQLGPIAVDYDVATVPVSLLGITMAALPFALSLDRLLNGLTRPFFGWVSDHIGRENTMVIAFELEGSGSCA
jgi:MFS transporter, OFA family, oxalate/formate antiporter